jgi:ABC-type multidrug transport system permease subunit
MFSLAIFNGMFNCMTVMPLIFGERTVFYRQKAASMFNPQALALAQGVGELPYLLVQAITMVVIVYWMVGLQLSAWKYVGVVLLVVAVGVVRPWTGRQARSGPAGCSGRYS